MPTIGQRITNFFLRDERKRLNDTATALVEALRESRYMPEAVAEQLLESDGSRLYDLILRMRNERVLIGGLDYDTRLEREVAVRESNWLWFVDVLCEWGVRTWVNFAFGEDITITIEEDERADEIFQEFWGAPRNAAILGDDKIHQAGERELVDGEVPFVFYRAADGKTTVRRVRSLDVRAVLTFPGDRFRPLFYEVAVDGVKGVDTMFYPDWQAKMMGWLDEPVTADGETKTAAEWVLPNGAVRADKVNEMTDVCMMLSAFNCKADDTRGWPLVTAGAPWFGAHKEFRENRASVAAAMAMYIQKIKAKGGSRGVDAIKAKLQSALNMSQYVDTNPPAAAGSTWIENEAATLERLSMNTGASDAQTDGNALLMMAALGMGLFPHWVGAGEAFRLATATSMEVPLLRQFSRHQQFWGQQWKNMAFIVLHNAGYDVDALTQLNISVSTDRLVEIDVPALTGALGPFVSQTLTPLVATMGLPAETARAIVATLWDIVLQGVGVANADELTSDDAFDVGQPGADAAEALLAIRRAIGALRLNPRGEVEL